MNKKAIYAATAVFLLTIALLSGCSANSSQPSGSVSTAASYDMATESPGAVAPQMSGSAEYADIAREDGKAAVANTATGEGDSMRPDVLSSDRMVIRSFHLSLQTMDFEGGITAIEAMAAEYGGFMQNSYVQGRSMYDKTGTRHANFTLRIPSEKLDMFVDQVGGIFNIINKQQTGEDITDQYYDTDARLKSLLVQEERLLAMLEQAGELEYLLQVERELANVRYEIENLTSYLLRMQNQVSMSTVYLNLEEVIEYTPVEPVPVTFGEEAAQAFRNSLKQFGLFIKNVVIAFIWVIPYVVAPIAITIIIIVVGKRKKAGRTAILKTDGADDNEGEQ